MGQAVAQADVLLAMQGDRDAFARIVRGHQGLVCSIALAAVHNLQASEDIAQEVFLTVWKKLGVLRNPESFLPWLRELSRNRAQDWLRAGRRRREVLATDDRRAQRACSLEGQVDESANPQHVLTSAEDRELIRSVMEELPADAREVMVLYYREGRSSAQVAELLELREVTVRKRLSRARGLMRSAILDRFGNSVARSSPGVALTLAIVGSTVFPAQAAAATLATKVASGAALGPSTGLTKILGTLLGGAFLGAAGGIASVVFGIRRCLAGATTPEERRELHLLGLLACTAILLFILVMARRPEVLGGVLAYAGLLSIMVWVYLVRIPALLDRRSEPGPSRRTRVVSMVLASLLGAASLAFAYWPY